MHIWFFVLKIFYNFIMEVYATLSLMHVISTEKPDLVYTNSMAILSGALAARFTKKPHIWHIREIVVGCSQWQAMIPKKIYARWINKCASSIIAPSLAAKNQFKNLIDLEKIQVVPNAVDIENFGSMQEKSSDMDIGEGDWVVAFIGAHTEIKAPDVAIKAVAYAKKKCQAIKLLVIGEGDKGYRNYLEELAASLDLGDKVFFLGPRDNIFQILSRCKVVVVPSRSESFGRVAVEAMALGVPVIATRAGGLTEIVVDGITGYLVSIDDAGEVAEKLVGLYEHPERIKEFGAKSRQRILERYLPQRYVNLIQEAVASLGA